MHSSTGAAENGTRVRGHRLAAALALVVLMAGCVSGRSPSLSGRVSPVSSPVTSAGGSPSPPASGSPPSRAATAGPLPSPVPREPSDTDRARFVADYRPGGVSDVQAVAADLDGDGRREIVFAYVVDAEGRTQVDVASWTGTRYAITVRVPGGPADDLRDLRVGDLNADSRVEIAVIQTVGTTARSVTLWAATGTGLVALSAVGDCFHGTNTYGQSDVELADTDGDGTAEIRAACGPAGVPAFLWPTAVYRWSAGAYRCDHRIVAGGLRRPCTR